MDSRREPVFHTDLVYRLCSLVVLLPTLALAQPAPAPDTGSAAPQPPPQPQEPQPSLANPPDITPAPPPHPVPLEEPTPAVDVEHNYEPAATTFKPGAYIQPQYRLRQDSPGIANTTDGFRFARVRLFANASTHVGNLDVSGYIEGEYQPQFSMYFAYLTIARALPSGGRVALDFGQARVPISHTNLMSDSFQAFVDKAQLVSIAPDHDLGARLWFVPPAAKWLRVVGSAWNGEGRNQVQNINQSLFYAGRVEVVPIGKDPWRESYFDGDFVTLGASAGRNKLSPTSAHHEIVKYYGADLEFAMRGLTGTFEYLEVRHDFDGDPMTAPMAYHANGFYAQLLYMLPLKLAPFRRGRFELGGRVEELDRNDAVPIQMPGDPNQSFRELTGVASYYLNGHYLKVQLAGSHFTQIENRTALGANATYPNDQLLLQVTYRME